MMAVISSWSATAKAQVGSGWTADTPVLRLQVRGCAAHSAAGGVETFRLTCADTGSDNRAEQRIENDYSAGTRQFEGEVRVVSLGGTNVSVKQTFMPNNGAFLMIAVAADGRLYSVGDNGVLATGVIGKWVRINTIHDVSAGTHKMFADGVLRVVKSGARQVAWHDKYGSYRLGSGRGPMVVEWRNIKFWKDGRDDGQSVMPPSGDAGSADAGSDAQTGDDGPAVADASSGTGGAPGTGGSSGSGGAGAGAGGSGGDSGPPPSGGSGGSGGMPGRDASASDRAKPPTTGGEAPADGCGCTIGGISPAGGGPLALLLLVLVGRYAGRRPRR
jgi:hypothetical protein